MEKCPRLNNNQIKELNQIIKQYESKGPAVRRSQAVLLLNEKVDAAAISTVTGYSRKHAFTLRRAYLKMGIEALQDKREGQPKELLTKKQRETIIKTVATTKPRDHKYDNEYWTTSILGAYVKKKYTVTYKSKTSYYLLFKQAKFTYHKPGQVYEKRDEAEVEKWKKATKRKVKQTLKKPNTVILVEDEMHLSTQTTFQKIWLPANEYPKIEVSSKRESRSVYGFLNISTGEEHAFKTKWQNMYITRDVLKKVRKQYPTQEILLIWDQAPWHKGSEAQKFIKEDEKIETIYFPRAAPEENPQEHVWKHGRSKVTHNTFIQDIDKATDEFVSHLNETKFTYSFLNLNLGATS
jgi:transposase